MMNRKVKEIMTTDVITTTSDVDTMVENVKKKLKGTEFDDKIAI